MWLMFELPLRPMPKKNSRGIFTNKKTGKSFLAENPGYRKFLSAGKKLLKKQMKERKLEPLKVQLRARYLFEYERKHHIADLCNLIVGMNDLVKDAGVIEDDSLVKIIDGAKVVEGLRDRCVVWFAPIETAVSTKQVGFDEAKKYLQKIATKSKDRQV